MSKRHINPEGLHRSPAFSQASVGDHQAMAVSGGQRNASASASEGVLKPRVCRGRPLSSAAIASNAA